MESHLQDLAFSSQFSVQFHAFDLERSPEHDLSANGLWSKLFAELDAGQWDVVLLSLWKALGASASLGRSQYILPTS